MIGHLYKLASNITDGATAAAGSLDQKKTVGNLFTYLSNTLIALIGAISVIMIIIGGLRYVLSNGNPAQTQGAKNTILYAVVGLVLSVSAYAIVKFVFDNFKIT